MGRRRKRQPPTSSSTRMDEVVERELEIFRTEAESAAQFFYAYFFIHHAAGVNKSVHRLLNTAPLFWNTILGGLQTGSFVVLGRIFDQNSAHNVEKLLKLALDNRQIFTKSALARRRQGASGAPPEWLESYLRHVYVPKVADFYRLRKYLSKWRKVYREKYQPIRHKVFAHKDVHDATDASILFARTNVRELERMLAFLLSLHEALWQLFHNGRKPALRSGRYSVKRMHERALSNVKPRSVTERLTHEALKFLHAASNGM